MAELITRDFSSMKVVELKEQLAKRGLTTSGNKSTLIARLSEHQKMVQQQAEEARAAENEKNRTQQQIITEVEKDISPPAKEQEDEPMQVEIKDDLQEGSKETQEVSQPQQESNENNSDEVSKKDKQAEPINKNSRQLDVTKRRLSGYSIKKADDVANESEERQRWGSKSLDKENKTVSISTNLLQDIMSDNSASDNVQKNNVEDTSTAGIKDTSTKLDNSHSDINNTRKFETSVNQGNIVQESEEITVPESAYPVNEIIQITNLVRPFTLMQLKEALREFGTIVEDGFWIDNIRSKCIVKYSSTEEASNARNGLYDKRWPSTSPKRLVVEFSNQEEMDRASGKLTEEVMEVEATSANIGVQSRPDHEESEEEGNKNTVEAPVNILDELFRKTDTSPHLYWLPLSEAEAGKRKTTVLAGNDTRKLKESSPPSRSRRSLDRPNDERKRRRSRSRSKSRRDYNSNSKDTWRSDDRSRHYDSRR